MPKKTKKRKKFNPKNLVINAKNLTEKKREKKFNPKNMVINPKMLHTDRQTDTQTDILHSRP
jgi:hypothetical protein